MTDAQKELCLESCGEMADAKNIRFVNATMAQIIIENRSPRGLFIQRVSAYKFIGIDNRAGKVRREEFATKFGCLDWLTDAGTAEAIRKRERQRMEFIR